MRVCTHQLWVFFFVPKCLIEAKIGWTRIKISSQLLPEKAFYPTSNKSQIRRIFHSDTHQKSIRRMPQQIAKYLPLLIFTFFYPPYVPPTTQSFIYSVNVIIRSILYKVQQCECACVYFIYTVCILTSPHPVGDRRRGGSHRDDSSLPGRQSETDEVLSYSVVLTMTRLECSGTFSL